MSRTKIVWYARGGGLSRVGPFDSLVKAWEAMRYSDELRAKTRYDHPEHTVVWPERVTKP